MNNREAQNAIVRNKGVFKYDPTMTEALDLAIKALHTVDIINEVLSPADEDKAIWFDIPHWEEIQERADMRGKDND